MILVTGGTGLVGSHLLYQLALEHETILATHRSTSNLELVKRVFGYYTKEVEPLFSKIVWKQADLVDISSLQDVFQAPIQYIYHCAAMISFQRKDYYTLRAVNIKGTANLVNLALLNGVKKFCFVSSIATIDKHPERGVITEEDEWNSEQAHHGYAITKYGAEMEVWRGSQEGLQTVIVNPGVILGAGIWKSGSGKLFSELHNGFKFYTKGSTGFVGIQDVVQCMIRLMVSPVTNERFILVGENISYQEVLFTIADGLGVKKPSIHINKPLSELVWRLDAIRGLLGFKRKLTKHMARSGQSNSYYSAEKISKALPFKFRPIKEVIKEVAGQYKQELSS